MVLGQKDFESFTAGIGMDQVNWPVAVTFAGEKLIVADTNNNRLLVWDSVPTENGAAADHVITSVNAENDLMWPWEVWSDGKKLIATSTEAGQVAFWDDVESAIAGETADLWRSMTERLRRITTWNRQDLSVRMKMSGV